MTAAAPHVAGKDPAPVITARQGAGELVLIVDDRPANLGFVVASLEAHGYRVIVAQGGEEALRRVDYAQPDLILLDAMMPDMSGFEVCRRLRTRAEHCEIPVIFMTALKQTENKLSAFALGAVDYLTKPLQVDEVVARVAAHLQLRGARLALQRQTRRLQQVQSGLRDEVALRRAELEIRNRLLQVELAERQAAELALQASAQRYQEVFDHVSDALYLIEVDAAGGFHYAKVNRAFCRLVGLADTAIIGRSAQEIFGPDAGRRMHGACLRCCDGGGAVDEEIVLELPSRRCVLQLTMVRFNGPGQAGGRLVGIGRDVTSVREYQTQLTQLASRDPLTGLCNRHCFGDHLARALARADADGGGVGLLLLDLDQFRDINHTLGRQYGDRLLKACAALLERVVRGGGLVARTGGDEFAILVATDGDGAALGKLASRVLRLLARPAEVDGYELVVSGSVGIVHYPHHGADAESLLCNVDTAMYRAKTDGGHRYQYFNADMNNISRRRMELGKAMRNAVRQAELSLHYQPRADRDGRHVVGAEALLRWNARLLGAVAPSEFIPLAEQNGLILQIGAWVLRHACLQARIWYDCMAEPIPVAVNLSARQFRDADLVHMVTAALDASGLPPHLLELELTESMLMQDAKGTLRTLAALKAIGVRLAVDDFGTGYSSLSYLKSFPLDFLKIDRSFVNGLPDDRNDGAIVRAIIAMAHTLGLKVIAEGVETAGQLAFLQAQNCNEFQGYLFSRPLAAPDMARFLCLDAGGPGRTPVAR